MTITPGNLFKLILYDFNGDCSTDLYASSKAALEAYKGCYCLHAYLSVWNGDIDGDGSLVFEELEGV